MTIWRLVLKEIAHRRLSFLLGLLAVATAAGCLSGAVTLLEGHNLKTRQILQAKQEQNSRQMARLEDDIRRAMLGLGFNVVILPADQRLDDWHADEYAASYMPDEYVERLAKSRIVTVQHLLPILQRKVRWPEAKRTILLVGTRGEIPGADPKQPLLGAVAPGSIVLGHELAEGLGFKVGDKLTLFGQAFTVSQPRPERGNKDDITAWISLDAAQELLGLAQGLPDKPRVINAILALECECALADLPKVREEITRILPRTQVIERSSEALARAEARRKVGLEAQGSRAREEAGRAALRTGGERLASILVPVVLLACATWVGLLMLSNVRQRRAEIGILRAVGVGSGRIMTLFVAKAVLTGLAGGALGYLAGFAVAVGLGTVGEPAGAATPSFRPTFALAVVAAAAVLSTVASWIPALLAAGQDPAEALREN